MRTPRCPFGGSVLALAVLVLLPAAQTQAQAPAPGPSPGPSPSSSPSPAPPDDTPTLRFGTTIYANYVYTEEPTSKDADGNVIHPNAFDTSRAYLTVSGNISHRVGYRVTADVGPHQTTTATGLPAGETVSSNYDGSLTFRLKYAYGQLNLDDVAGAGAWARLGMQQTPYLDFAEGIYRYRFQGTVFMEREGYQSSSDLGLAGHYSLPGSYGDIHAGVYNGENYTKAETNDQKAFKLRATLRPAPRVEVLKGLRLTAYLDTDHYVQGAPRKRFVASVTFEHQYLNAGFDHLDAWDRTSVHKPEAEASGYSVWATPRTPRGLEGLFRYDRLQPDQAVDARKSRTIAGLAYWFRVLKDKAPTAAAVLADYERVGYDAALGRPKEVRYGVHCLFNF